MTTQSSKVPLDESVGTLAELQSEGKIRHIGLSNVSVNESPGHGSERPDCVAGHVGLELRNVVAKPFERSHRFPVIEPNSGRRDYSRLSCGVGDTQLGAGFCGDLHGRWPSCGVADKARIGRDLFRSEDDRPAANQQHHCSVCAGLSAQRERVW